MSDSSNPAEKQRRVSRREALGNIRNIALASSIGALGLAVLTQPTPEQKNDRADVLARQLNTALHESDMQKCVEALKAAVNDNVLEITVLKVAEQRKLAEGLPSVEQVQNSGESSAGRFQAKNFRTAMDAGKGDQAFAALAESYANGSLTYMANDIIDRYQSRAR